MTLAEINPLGRARGRLVRRRSTRTWTWRTRPAPRQKALLDELGVGDEETRQAREATRVRARRRGGRRAGPPRRGRQRHRVRRQPRPGHRRRRRLADALRRRARARRRARPTTARSAATRRVAQGVRAWPSSCSQKPGVDKIAVMMSIVSNTRVDIVARGVIKACLELGYDPAEKIAIFRIPGRLGGGGLQDPRALRRRLRRPLACRCTRRPGGRWRRSGGDEHPHRRGHDLHRPGHHRPRGGQPDARVPGLRRRREDRRRRHARAAWAATSTACRCSTPSPRPSSTTAARSTARSSPSRPRSPRTPCSRRSRTASSSIVIVTERIPRRDVAQMVELASAARRAHHRPQLPGDHRPRRHQDGRHRRPGQGRRQVLHAAARSA